MGKMHGSGHIAVTVAHKDCGMNAVRGQLVWGSEMFSCAAEIDLGSLIPSTKLT